MEEVEFSLSEHTSPPLVAFLLPFAAQPPDCFSSRRVQYPPQVQSAPMTHRAGIKAMITNACFSKNVTNIRPMAVYNKYILFYSHYLF